MHAHATTSNPAHGIGRVRMIRTAPRQRATEASHPRPRRECTSGLRAHFGPASLHRSAKHRRLQRGPPVPQLADTAPSRAANQTPLPAAARRREPPCRRANTVEQEPLSGHAVSGPTETTKCAPFIECIRRAAATRPGFRRGSRPSHQLRRRYRAFAPRVQICPAARIHLRAHVLAIVYHSASDAPPPRRNAASGASSTQCALGRTNTSVASGMT